MATPHSDQPSDQQELATLRAATALNNATDECLERAIKARLTLAQTLADAMAVLLQHVDAGFAAVRTWDESMQLRNFMTSPDGVSAAQLEAHFKHAEGHDTSTAENNVLVQRLDVAGEMFGCVVVGDGQCSLRF